MMPVTTKDACFNLAFFALGNHPFDKILAPVIMFSRIVAHAIMYIRENGCVRKIWIEFSCHDLIPWGLWLQFKR